MALAQSATFKSLPKSSPLQFTVKVGEVKSDDTDVWLVARFGSALLEGRKRAVVLELNPCAGPRARVLTVASSRASSRTARLKGE